MFYLKGVSSLVTGGGAGIGRAIVLRLARSGSKVAVADLRGEKAEEAAADLGTDVAPQKFVDAIKQHKPQLVGMSALLTTTMLAMKDTIAEIDKAGLRKQVKIMIGGAPIRQEFADEIGADFYGPDPAAGRNYAREVVSGES